MIIKESKGTHTVGLVDSLSRLSFDKLLDELAKMKLKLGVIIPIIFEKGKEQGLNEITIRDKIRTIIDIPERTLSRYLPEGAKQHKYPKVRKLAKLANYNETTNSTSTQASNLEPVANVLSRPDHKTEFVYRNWTLEEFICRYEEIEQENFYLNLQLTDANTRIEELEESLEEQGLMVYEN
jgi:hypothetical protein